MAKTVVLHSARLLVAMLVLAMASSKVSDPAWLAKMNIAWLNQDIGLLAGRWLPWLELSLSLMLMCPGVWRPASKICACLLLAFLPVLLLFALEGRADCGCSKGLSFVPGWFSNPYFALVRNSAMAALLWKSASIPSISARFRL